MSSYLRLPFGRSPSTSSSIRGGPSVSATPDFSAFDLDDNDEDDEEEDGMLSTTSRSNHSTSNHNLNSGGTISQGDEVSDPLTQHQNGQGSNHHALQQSSTTTGTSSYDFEPQAHEGGGGSAASSPPRANTIRNAGRSLHSGDSEAGQTPSSNNLRTLRDRFLPSSLYSRTQNRSDDDEADGLLFDQDEDDSTERRINDSTASSMGITDSSYPPRGIAATHVPLPSRPPQFSSSVPGSGRIYGGGQANDGVFGNLSAKPDGYPRGSDYVGGDEGGDKDEVLPSYSAAAMDATPPYWETTVIAPHGFLGPDDICVDGLPVGNLFGFMWNLLVSMSFQFVGFLLTYLLHTTHAAKNGSRAGLGITLIQLGLYLKQRADHPELLLMELNGTNPNAMEYGPGVFPNDDPTATRWTWWGGVVVDPDAANVTATATTSAMGSIPTQVGGVFTSVLEASDPDATGFPTLRGNVTTEDLVRMSTSANEWLAFMMVTVGAFLFVGGCLSYWRAVRWARAVSNGQGPSMTEA